MYLVNIHCRDRRRCARMCTKAMPTVASVKILMAVRAVRERGEGCSWSGQIAVANDKNEDSRATHIGHVRDEKKEQRPSGGEVVRTVDTFCAHPARSLHSPDALRSHS